MRTRHKDITRLECNSSTWFHCQS